jgi:hypothetical protein
MSLFREVWRKSPDVSKILAASIIRVIVSDDGGSGDL